MNTYKMFSIQNCVGLCLGGYLVDKLYKFFQLRCVPLADQNIQVCGDLCGVGCGFYSQERE